MTTPTYPRAGEVLERDLPSRNLSVVTVQWVADSDGNALVDLGPIERVIERVAYEAAKTGAESSYSLELLDEHGHDVLLGLLPACDESSHDIKAIAGVTTSGKLVHVPLSGHHRLRISGATADNSSVVHLFFRRDARWLDETS